MRRFASLLLATLALSGFTYTDPEPDPFSALKEGESVYAGIIISTTDGALTVRAKDGTRLSGKLAEALRYREAGGPADVQEFAAGDRVRAIGAAGELTAVQDQDIVKCGIEFYGRATAVTSSGFVLVRTDGSRYPVRTGKLTQYRRTDGALTSGITLQEGDAVRVHGVFSRTTHLTYTETLGAYISLLTQETLAPLIESSESATAVQKKAFSDVSETDPFAPSVWSLAKMGVIAGYADGTFRPLQTVNRAEFAKMLIVARADTEGVPTDCFPDIPADAWYASYACALQDSGFAGGYPDGTFRGSATINLAEALKITLLAYGYDIPAPLVGEAWYAPYVTLARSLGIVRDSETPDAALTRSRFAELLISLQSARYLTTP